MGWLTKYGTIWGAIPQTAGNVYWVSAGDTYTVEGRTYSASNDNDGLSPERALRRVDRAVDLATGSGDVVVLLPGAHTVTASIAADTANVTITGLPGGRGNYLKPRTTLACSAVDETMNVTAAGIEIAYIEFKSTTSQAAALIDVSANGDELYVHDCSFDLYTATAATTILGIDSIGAHTGMLVERCHFSCDGAFGASIDLTASLGATVDNCIFRQTAGTLASTITVGAATDQAIIKSCVFMVHGSGVVTANINGTGATIASGVLVASCTFSDLNTVPIDNFDAAECEIVECYEAGVGGTDGGVLITAIT